MNQTASLSIGCLKASYLCPASLSVCLPCLFLSVCRYLFLFRVCAHTPHSLSPVHASSSPPLPPVYIPTHAKTLTTGRSGKNFRATGDTHMYWHRAVCRAPGAALHYRRVRARARTQKHTLYTPARAHTRTHPHAHACTHKRAQTPTFFLTPTHTLSLAHIHLIRTYSLTHIHPHMHF